MWRLLASSIEHGGGLIAPVSSLLIMLVKNAILMSSTVCSVSHYLIGLLAHDDSAVVVADDRRVDAVAAAQPARRQCDRCADHRRGGEAGLSRHDVAAVMASLGLVEGPEEEEDENAACGGCEAVAAVEELTECKVAGEGELREAFYVFDRDEDGYVTAAELWSVLRRLRMEEGARYGDCVRMIAAHDGDGDGRISFREFRAMMENAV